MDTEKVTTKEVWLTALRSGEYEQATGYLREGDAFCCLGVACDLYAKATGKGSWEQRSERKWISSLFDKESLDPGYVFVYKNDNGDEVEEHEELPNIVAEWLGLTDPFVEVTYLNEDGEECGGDVASLNDEGVPFAKLADYLEKSLP